MNIPMPLPYDSFGHKAEEYMESLVTTPSLPKGAVKI